MGWLTPKTNWEIKPLVDGLYQGDWFNYTDFNRIAGNLRYLHAAGQNVYSATFSIPSITDQSVNNIPHASDLNALEDALYAIATNTFMPEDYSGKVTWVANGATPTVDDLNRIEEAIADIYTELNAVSILQQFSTDSSEPVITSDGSYFMVRQEV